MKLENYEVHLPNYSIGDKIYDKIGPVCESYGKKVLVIGGRKALAAAYDKIESYVKQTSLEIIGKEIYGENCTYATVEKLRQMQKLDVILMRMNSRRERSVAITENDPYYEKVVRRVTLLKKRGH